jgi:cytochrome P450 family 4
MQFTLFFLALHPTWQQRVYDEMLEVFGTGNSDGEETACDITHEHIAELKCLDWCWKESIRLYSPIPIIGRKLGEDIPLGKNRSQRR